MKKMNRSILSGLCCALVLVALAATVAVASGGGGHEGGSVTPEKLKDLLWRVMNFAVLVVILLKFMVKPIRNILDARRQAIVDEFEDLEARQSEAQYLYKNCEKKLSVIDVEIGEIMDKAKAQGEKEKERIIAEAKQSAADIRRQAEMAIQQEMKAARQRLKAEIAEEAVKIAAELIAKNMTAEDQERLVTQSLDSIGTVQ